MKLKLMGRKRGTIQIFDENGLVAPCTIIEIEPNILTSLLSEEKNGYDAVQLGFEKCSAKCLTKHQLGHFKKNSIEPRRHLAENRVDSLDGYNIGDEFGAVNFLEVPFVDVTAISKGKGYQGVMKLYNYAGGRASHGCSRAHRSLGSTGMRSTPGRCLPGGKRACHMGLDRVTTQNLKIMQVIENDNLILVKGAVPGPRGGLVYVSRAKKKK